MIVKDSKQEPFPLPHIDAECGDLCLRAETVTQHPIRVQLAQPSIIADIRFAIRRILETGNDSYRFKASSKTAKKKRKETAALTAT